VSRRRELAIAVPVKDLGEAKHRLEAALAGEARHRLAAAMLEDVLDALAEAAVGEVWLVTRDPEALALAAARGLTCLTESANRGHTAAVALAQAEAARRGFGRFLTVPGDVPCVSAAELRRLAGALGAGPGVAFTPSRSGLGTNGALLAPPDAMPLTFGEPSFANHLAAARARGFEPAVVELPGLGLDVDVPDDLAMLLERGPHTRAGALVRRLGQEPRPAARA